MRFARSGKGLRIWAEPACCESRLCRYPLRFIVNGPSPLLAAEFRAIGGRALREMTRLGASPYSMWRDVAFTNTKPLAATLFALEQRLAHIRENLKTAELREEFEKANEFRRKR